MTGRGRLIALLKEANTASATNTRTSSDEETTALTTTSSGNASTSDKVLDSGLGTATGSPISGRGRLMGRGLLLSSTSSSSMSDSTSSVPKLPMGRAKLIQIAKGSSSTSSSSISDGGAQAVAQLTTKFEAVTLPPVVEQEPVIKIGTAGRPVNVMTNYIRLKTDRNKGVFEYDVKFDCAIHDQRQRMRLLNQHRDTIGNTKSYDGIILYLPHRLPDNSTILTSKNERENSIVKIELIYKRQKRLGECTQLYNILFGRVLTALKFVSFGRKKYDPSGPMMIPQHKLEVWPGYVTAVDEYEDGVMLCLDASHRVLCQETVLDVLKDVYHQDRENYKKNVVARLLGAVVLTRYNDKTYRIDDIDFSSTPKDTFHMKDETISYIEYYKRQYDIDIKDRSQPLLVNRIERRIAGKEEKQEIRFCLIPEICYLTGLTDKMRSDFKVMRDIATFTRVTPNQRMKAYQTFCENVNKSPEARDILKNWGLTLDDTSLQIKARQFDEENVQFKQKEFGVGRSADFNKHVTANEVLEVVPLKNWLVIHTKKDGTFAKRFIDCMERNSKPMGITVARPRIETLETDKTELYVQLLRKCITTDLQIVVIICPTSRDDRYAAIKKVCCSELPIPSQVINARTLANEDKCRQITQKIALQMNCKMGGALWSIKIPMANTMIIGIDSYHDSNKQANSVSAFVASIDSKFTHWFSQAGVQSKKEEFVNSLVIALNNALKAYKKRNGNLPERIIIFRDGVGDGQLNMCKEYEIPQLKKACTLENPDYEPLITFIVVQKRINTRIFAMGGREGLENPNPGTVIDHSITRRYLYDFFLVPQSVRQGTVSPTHYIVVEDMVNFKPDIIQRLSYKMCFLYYNWPGSVRVPACCQYAHKLAYLVGQSIKKPTSERLSERLFYL